MKVNQVFDFVNIAAKETLGDSAVVQEDLSNIVDIGKEIFDANAFDAYTKNLINHIGKTIFVNRPYSGSAPSVLMDGWEFGSVLQKIAAKLPVAIENPSWNLVDGTSYDPHVFHQPEVSEKFYNKRTTFEIDRSVTEMQVRQSFSSAEQLNGFMSMLENEITKGMTIRTDDLIMRVINNMAAETILHDYPTATDFNAKSGVRAINLLKLYNDKFSPNPVLTADKAMTDPGFIRYSAYVMALYSERLTRISKLFNCGAMDRFTPKDLQHFVMLSDFAVAADVYLQSDTYHDEYTKLLSAEKVPYWQGSGTGTTAYDFFEISRIKAIPASQETVQEKKVINVSGVLAVMFDRDALGVANLDRRVTTEYNPKAEFTNYFYKQDCGYFNDLNENFIVFFAA